MAILLIMGSHCYSRLSLYSSLHRLICEQGSHNVDTPKAKSDWGLHERIFCPVPARWKGKVYKNLFAELFTFVNRFQARLLNSDQLAGLVRSFTWGDVKFAAFEVFDDHIDGAFDGSEVFVDHLERIPAEFLPA